MLDFVVPCAFLLYSLHIIIERQQKLNENNNKKKTLALKMAASIILINEILMLLSILHYEIIVCSACGVISEFKNYYGNQTWAEKCSPKYFCVSVSECILI